MATEIDPGFEKFMRKVASPSAVRAHPRQIVALLLTEDDWMAVQDTVGPPAGSKLAVPGDLRVIKTEMLLQSVFLLADGSTQTVNVRNG